MSRFELVKRNPGDEDRDEARASASSSPRPVPLTVTRKLTERVGRTSFGEALVISLSPQGLNLDGGRDSEFKKILPFGGDLLEVHTADGHRVAIDVSNGPSMLATVHGASAQILRKGNGELLLTVDQASGSRAVARRSNRSDSNWIFIGYPAERLADMLQIRSERVASPNPGDEDRDEARASATSDDGSIHRLLFTFDEDNGRKRTSLGTMQSLLFSPDGISGSNGSEWEKFADVDVGQGPTMIRWRRRDKSVAAWHTTFRIVPTDLADNLRVVVRNLETNELLEELTTESLLGAEDDALRPQFRLMAQVSTITEASAGQRDVARWADGDWLFRGMPATVFVEPRPCPAKNPSDEDRDEARASYDATPTVTEPSAVIAEGDKRWVTPFAEATINVKSLSIKSPKGAPATDVFDEQADDWSAWLVASPGWKLHVHLKGKAWMRRYVDSLRIVPAGDGHNLLIDDRFEARRARTSNWHGNSWVNVHGHQSTYAVYAVRADAPRPNPGDEDRDEARASAGQSSGPPLVVKLVSLDKDYFPGSYMPGEFVRNLQEHGPHAVTVSAYAVRLFRADSTTVLPLAAFRTGRPAFTSWQGAMTIEAPKEHVVEVSSGGRRLMISSARVAIGPMQEQHGGSGDEPFYEPKFYVSAFEGNKNSVLWLRSDETRVTGDFYGGLLGRSVPFEKWTRVGGPETVVTVKAVPGPSRNPGDEDRDEARASAWRDEPVHQPLNLAFSYGTIRQHSGAATRLVLQGDKIYNLIEYAAFEGKLDLARVTPVNFVRLRTDGSDYPPESSGHHESFQIVAPDRADYMALPEVMRIFCSEFGVEDPEDQPRWWGTTTAVRSHLSRHTRPDGHLLEAQQVDGSWKVVAEWWDGDWWCDDARVTVTISLAAKANPGDEDRDEARASAGRSPFADHEAVARQRYAALGLTPVEEHDRRSLESLMHDAEMACRPTHPVFSSADFAAGIRAVLREVPHAARAPRKVSAWKSRPNDSVGAWASVIGDEPALFLLPMIFGPDPHNPEPRRRKPGAISGQHFTWTPTEAGQSLPQPYWQPFVDGVLRSWRRESPR